MTDEQGRIRKRQTFFLHGFDPRGPAAYHRMYTEEAAKQAARDGITLQVGQRHREGPHAAGWQIEADFGDGPVHTAYTFLRWDDIVRANWPKAKWPLLQMVGRYLHAFNRARFLGILRQGARPAYLAIMFPPATIAVFALAGLMCAWLLGWLAVEAGLPWWGAVPVFGLVLVGWWFLWDKLESALNPCWLARVFGFLTDWAGGRVGGLEERHKIFASAFAEALDDPANEEVLVIGHSIGAQHAIEALFLLEGQRPGSLSDPRLRFLTLGQCIPLLARLHGTEAFNKALGALICDHPLVWIDVTSPADPASSCAVDPLAPTQRLRPEGAPVHPFHVSPRFHTLLPRETFRRVRRDPLLFHFQYLRSQDLAGSYDYYRLTAGPHRMAPFGRRIAWTVMAGDLR